MRRFLVLMALIAFFAPLAAAQDTDNRFEFFGGYSLLREDIDSEDEIGDTSENLNGFNVAATGYLTERFGITGDISGHFRNDDFSSSIGGTTTNFEAKSRAFNFLAGPQYRFTNSTRVTPFVRALAGVQNRRVEFDVEGTNTPDLFDFDESATDFALAIGGGLDVRVSDRVAIRAFQIDYNPVFERDRTITAGGFTDTFEGQRVDNARFSIGVVFK
ncbi:MAG: porin family protein [Pyrinomonadaceae bacterium MAG19_C2-C3]|nr:porin family protein [Pyrinomonadaceae bacterium MAG19_C2-C3]